MALPLTRKTLDEVIRKQRNRMRRGNLSKVMDQLREVQRTQRVEGEESYNALIPPLFVYEYVEDGDSWYAVNPILEEDVSEDEG